MRDPTVRRSRRRGLTATTKFRYAGLLAIAAAWSAACGGQSAPPVKSAASVSQTAATRVETSAASNSHEESSLRCDVVCGAATVVRHEITPDESADYHTNEAVEKANTTLNGMHDDLLACYAARVRAYPKAHAFLTIDVIVGPSGAVQNVETQGGALLGDRTMKCIVDRIKQGEFAPPPRGGTMRLQIPLTLRRLGPDDTI